MSAAPVITLRAVRYGVGVDQVARFSAVVDVDGRPFCYVRNDGGGAQFSAVGGGVDVRMLGGAVLAVARRVNPEAVDFHVPLLHDSGTLAEFCRQLEGEWWTHGPRYSWHVFEALVDVALDNWLVSRDLARAFRSKVLFAIDGKVWERPQEGRTVEEVAAAIRAKHPEAVILNQQPLPEAVRIMRAATFAL